MFARNRRKFTRLSVHHLIKYKGDGCQETLSFARNVSASGILFHSQHQLIPRGIVDLTLNFPDSDEPLKVRARIVWIKSLKRVGGFDVGAEFIDLDKSTVDVINTKILDTCARVGNKKK